MRHCLVLAAVALAACGCAKTPKFAPVKGKVTLDGKALANVVVSFQPTGKDPGPGSSGITDAQGYYTLTVQQVEGDGAVVGEHVVRIAPTLPGEAAKPTDPTVGSPDGLSPEQLKEMKQLKQIPAKYNQNSELRFTVPPGGTTEANFDLKSKG